MNLGVHLSECIKREVPAVDSENWTSKLPYLRNGARSFKVMPLWIPMESLYVTVTSQYPSQY